MSKSLVKTLVSDLSLGQSDSNTVEKFYQDSARQVSQFPLLTQARLVEITEDTNTYTADDSIGRILEMFYDENIINREELEDVSWERSWQDQVGTPISYIKETEDAKDFRLYPTPDASSKDFTFLFGASFGVDFPEYAVGIIHTEIRDDNPDWMDLIFALLVLTKEMAQDSAYKDLNLAKAANETANTFLRFVANATAQV